MNSFPSKCLTLVGEREVSHKYLLGQAKSIYSSLSVLSMWVGGHFSFFITHGLHTLALFQEATEAINLMCQSNNYIEHIGLTWPDPIFVQGVIACSISTPHEKGLVRFTGLTGTETTIVVVVVN